MSRNIISTRLLATATLAGLVLVACSSSKSANVVRTPVPPATTSSAVTTSSAASSASSSAGSATSSAAKAHPTATVTPSTGLKDKQLVQVAGSGFTPQEALQVIECADKGNATGPGDCNLASMQSVVSDTSGHVRAQLQVLRGPFGGNSIVCGPKQRCLVSVTQAALVPTEEADVPIQFATS